MDYKKLYEQGREQYEGLSQEFDNINDSWGEDNVRNNEIIMDQHEQIKQLKEVENYLDERYKGTCMYLIKDCGDDSIRAETLLEKVKCIDDSRLYLLQENEDLNSRWAKKRDEDGDSYRRLIMEVKEDYRKILIEKDEEIQTYKETLDEHFHHYDNLKEKNKKLKEENEKLKEELSYVKAYILMSRGRDTHKEFCECLGEDFGIKYENILYPENPDNHKLILQYKQE